MEGELLEARFWAVAREDWDVETYMQTCLHLAERMRVKLRPTSSASPSVVSNASLGTLGQTFTEEEDVNDNDEDEDEDEEEAL